MDCGKNTFHGDYYMVRDELWMSAVGKQEGMLCLGCLEGRIGRPLVADDFPPLPINDWWFERNR